VSTSFTYTDQLPPKSDVDRRAAARLKRYLHPSCAYSRTVRTAFDDAPWASQNELETTLKHIPGVASATYEAAMDGMYRAPRVHLSVPTRDLAAVGSDIQSYYDGLALTTTGQYRGVAVLTTPQWG
jgi:hypothetical protein